MKKVNLLLTAVLVGVISTTSLTSCKEKGCTDPSADNFSIDAKKDNGTCTFPTINFTSATNDGDVVGGGGDATSTFDWDNSLATAELNMDITAADGGSFQVIIKDADGTEVANETLTVGVGDDSRNICSASGTPGAWTITVVLTDFNGDGSYSLSQGC
ncbi:MAG: hypothetical protein ABFS32_04275 [Bacteroidota bacterium]